MATVKSLTVDEAKKNPSMFLYVFATNEYLNAIDSKYAKIIRGKKANQEKLLKISADEYLGDWQKWTQYKDAIKQGFENIYGITPVEALVKLALGEEVAGKNWSEGVYGVGAIHPTTFYGTNVTVDKTTGHIFKDGVDYTDESRTENENYKGQAFPMRYCAVIDEATYISQYYKTGKYYYAKTYSNPNGTFSAKSGTEIKPTDAASVWENVQLGAWDFLDWLKSLLEFFGIKITSESNSNSTLNTKNTLPNQKADGYVQESGFSEAAAIALLAVAGGTMLAGGFFKKKNGNK